MENKIGKNKPKEGLSPEEKQIAMSLENFRFLDSRDRVYLVLVWRGLKTASPVSLEFGKEMVNELRERIEGAGLFLKPTDKVTEKKMYGLRPGRICFVANNKEDLDLISELWFGNKERDPKVYTELGRMSGYPQTAIDAYGKMWPKIGESFDENRITPMDLMVSEDEKIEKLKKEPELIPFAVLFYMSRKNFNNELETARKWAREIRLVTPALYQSFISDFKRFRDNVES